MITATQNSYSNDDDRFSGTCGASFPSLSTSNRWPFMLQPASDQRKTSIEVAASMPAAEIENYSAHVHEILLILRRRIWVIVGTMLTVISAAVLFVQLVTPRYTATATVLIDPQRSKAVDTDNKQSTVMSASGDDSMINSQVLLLQSVPVLQRVVDELDLAHDPEFGPHETLLAPIKRLLATPRQQAPGLSADDVAKSQALQFLSKRLNVQRDGTSFVIDVNVISEDPEKASKIANAVVNSYFYEQVHSKYDTTKIAASWFNHQLDALKSKVLASDRAVEEFRAKNNLTATQGVTVNDQQLQDLNNKLIDAHVQTAEARAKFEQVENIIKTHADPGMLDQALSSDVIARLRQQYADVVKNLADVSSKFGPQHPLVVNARAQVQATQKLIDQEVHRILEATRQAYQVAQSREDALRTSLDNLKNVSNQSGIEQVRLRELQREADANRTLYETFLARYKETNAQESLALPDSRLIAKADIPVQPSFPKTMLILALAAALGLSFGCLLALGVDYIDRRVKSLHQAEIITGTPTLAAIPLVGPRELSSRASRGRQDLNGYDPGAPQLLPPSMQPPLMRYVIEEPTSLFAESVRAVRLSLQRAARNAPVKSVMVTSSIDGEGKTTLAVNLAQSLATIGLKTILVEGDLRNPEMSRSLCPRATIGAIEVATGEAHFRDALLMDRVTGLTILPSPSKDRDPDISEFIFSNAMRAMLDRVQQEFEYVVIDAPPLVPLVDARALADLADRIVLAIRWDSTPRDVVAQAIETLMPAYEHLLGTVLTRVDMQRLRLYDYYRSSPYVTPYSYLGQPRIGRAS
jgi:exopolysaccharide transport family protein